VRIELTAVARGLLRSIVGRSSSALARMEPPDQYALPRRTLRVPAAHPLHHRRVFAVAVITTPS